MWGCCCLLVCFICGVIPAPFRIHTGMPSPSMQPQWALQTGSYWVNVKCSKSQVVVMVQKDAVEQLVKATGLSLGSCPYTHIEKDTVVFAVALQQCGSQVQLTPDTVVYRNVLLYKPEIASRATADSSMPSETLIECHYPRQVPLEGSRYICMAKSCRGLAKRWPTAVRQPKQNLYRRQAIENSSLNEMEPNVGIKPVSVPDTIQEEKEKVVMVKLPSTGTSIQQRNQLPIHLPQHGSARHRTSVPRQSDSVCCEGRTLLKSFVEASARRVLLHDVFRDPLGWAGQGSAMTLGEFSAAELVGRLAPAWPGPATVMLDSLSWLLLRLPFPSVCQVLAQLPRRAKVTGMRIARLVALLHGDLHQPGQLETLHALARAVVMLEPAPGTATPGDEAPRVAVTSHRKKGGKALQKPSSLPQKEHFTVLPGFILKHLGELPQHGISKEDSTEDGRVPATADPTANLTFNLCLSEAQRQAKESVPLPYHFSQEKKSSLLQTPASQGKIYYEPDAADDIDEEDPDDDLDV
ncbi:elongator complex protein 5 isoform X4 [Rhineura floridana]|uniref:elongator complex protein 5 isoform X4 n=1 Tax=Rhineura floridana TaxID=261503 RepID=UPI002AC826F4|nr:elongator complex protein 5 isoform X4 [Rhineura floridana]